LELYSAEPLVRETMPLEVLANENHLASGPFVTPDEEVVAAILDRLGVPWQYEARRFLEFDARGKFVREATGDLAVLWNEHWLILEVKGRHIGSRHQRQLAIQAGYGFAYVTRLMDCDYDRRIRKVKGAIEEAEASRTAATHKLRSCWRNRMRTEYTFSLRLVRVA